MICLEGAQAGLSWETILNKRAAYRKAFRKFDLKKCSRLTDSELKKLLKDPGIVRNRLKVFSVRSNADAFLAVQKEFGSFDRYLWKFVGGKPVLNHSKGSNPASTEVSDALSKDLKKKGFRFVGTTICYAYMQAVGMVNDHAHGCYLYKA
jgi:DNA-3-methyladenine glycosylase I